MAPKLTKRELERERLASESAAIPAAKAEIEATAPSTIEPTTSIAARHPSEIAMSLAPGTTNAPPSLANSYHAYHPMDQVLLLLVV